MTTHFRNMAASELAACGASTGYFWSGRWDEVTCEYCLNARPYGFHRADVANVPGNVRRGAAAGYAPPRGTKEAQDSAESAVVWATLKAWHTRLKYASQSQVADFRPEELKPLVEALAYVLR